MIKKTIEERFKQLSPLEHILKKPGMYIGNIYTEPTKMFIFNDINEIKNNKFIYETVQYNAGFCKLFDEILTNASDHSIRTGKVKYIKIEVCNDHVTVENDGDGIPVVLHKEKKVYVPYLVFGELFSGENFNDSDKRLVGGTHGLGASLTNIYSKKFIVETADGKHKYVQTFTDNMSNKTKPKISKSTKNYTKITYYPDFEKFNLTEITDEIQSIFCKRAIDVAAYNPGVKVYYNDTLIPIKSFKDYMKMFIDDEEEFFYEKINDNWEIGVSRSQTDVFQQVSMVNGISTHVGGTHVNYITNQIVKILSEKIEKGNKNSNIKQVFIKNHLFLFLSCRIPNPDFETQTKENLVSRMTNDIIKDVNISDNFIKKLMSSEIKNDIVNFASLKELQEAKKSTQNGKKVKVRIAKLDDANKAGKNPENLKCHLFLTEGDSAASTAKRGFAVTGNDYFGLFPLKGKPLNIRDVSLQKMRENEEINSIISALGLEFGKKYNSTRSLRYGKLVIMSDADHDGSHIRGLVINIFDKYWPELLELDFIYEFITPIVKIKKGNKVKYFYRLKDYLKWKETGEKGYFIKWIKGLGTIEPTEAKLFFKDISKHLIRFNSSDIKKEKDLIDLAFNKKRVEDRKEWLLNYKPTLELDKFKTKQTYSSFFNNEFIEYSMADNIRSIPSLMDGLKPSQRKILYTLFERNFKNEVKVELLMGSILELAAYHHGPQSLESSIIGLAQNFVGSNNINLLEPNGEYGTRLKGGKDASASRYIFTKLSNITRDIFKQEDDNILEYLNDDGYKIEPKFYIPIIPMALVNGSDGIGTGWSTLIPHFNPLDIIEYIESVLKNKKKKIELKPWFKNFKGEIIEDLDNKRYITRGVFKMLPNNRLNITELPIYTWNNSYYEFLDKLIDEKVIKDYDKYCTDSEVNIVITMVDNTNLTDDFIIKKFNLESYISINNMNLFDIDNKIHLYGNQYEIVDDFITNRIHYYTLRKQYLLNKLEEQKKYTSNKIKFIDCILKKKIIIENKQKENIIKQIEQNKIEMYNDSYDYLLNMSLLSLSKEKLDELQLSYDKLISEIEKINKISENEMWLADLSNLKNKLKN